MGRRGSAGLVRKVLQGGLCLSCTSWLWSLAWLSAAHSWAFVLGLGAKAVQVSLSLASVTGQNFPSAVFFANTQDSPSPSLPPPGKPLVASVAHPLSRAHGAVSSPRLCQRLSHPEQNVPPQEDLSEFQSRELEGLVLRASCPKLHSIPARHISSLASVSLPENQVDPPSLALAVLQALFPAHFLILRTLGCPVH